MHTFVRVKRVASVGSPPRWLIAPALSHKTGWKRLGSSPKNPGAAFSGWATIGLSSTVKETSCAFRVSFSQPASATAAPAAAVVARKLRLVIAVHSDIAAPEDCTLENAQP